MRRVPWLAALLVVASCGGGPVSPTIQTTSPAMNIASGPFLMTIAMATSGSSGFTACVSLSIGSGSGGLVVVPPPAAPSPAPVEVVRSGNAIVVRPDDMSSTFRMDLQLNGAMLSGAMSGQLQVGTTTFIAAGPESTSAPNVTGIVGPSSITGTLTGTASNGSMSCTNNGHAWSLSPR